MSSVADLKGRSILIAGSAHPTCPPEKLRLAHSFVTAAVGSILQAGGNLVVFASSEPTTEGNEELPLIFDWLILKAVKQHFSSLPRAQIDGPRVWAITSNKALERKIPKAHRELLSRLSDEGLADVTYISDELHTGGNIVEAELLRADAMIAIGGGKGVADRAFKMERKRAPVLPLDLELGALCSDGEGAMGLLKQARTEPKRFFPWTAEHFRRNLLSLSLNGSGVDPQVIATRAVQLLSNEFEAAKAGAPVDVVMLTALPEELDAAKRALELSASAPPTKIPSTGTNYWSTELVAYRAGRAIRVVLSCIGGAGTDDAAASATELVTEFQPGAVVMVGIAAGMRGKCKLGDVLIADRVIGYEPAALISDTGERRLQPRPESYRLAHSLHQDVVSYISAETELRSRLGGLLKSLGVLFPTGVADTDAAPGLSVRLATFVSGQKLIRDPDWFVEMRDSIHGKIEAGEMEAAGIAAACRRGNIPFLIVRGISDFGDSQKDDRFHHLAAMGAAVAAVDFIKQALGLDVRK